METIATLTATYENMLGAMSGLLAKAAESQSGKDLLEARLAEDMLPLAAQVRFVANLPGEALDLLGGPSFRPAEEDPSNLEVARAMIVEARVRVGEARTSRFMDEDESVLLALPNGMTFDMTARDYVRDWALPQFYFHIVAAYAILRSEGIAVGKADYVPHMFAYLRGGTGEPGSTSH